jgi:cyclic pyranopterin phosphate synthase
MKKLSHIDDEGKATMVDVGHKAIVARKAVATGFIKLKKETLVLIGDNQIKKGDVTTVAEIAGIQAAKQTPALIPLCHTLLLDKVELKTHVKDDGIEVRCMVKSVGKTGVEMEALTGVSVALLTIYDMCKAVDREMEISVIRLLEKSKTEIL